MYHQISSNTHLISSAEYHVPNFRKIMVPGILYFCDSRGTRLKGFGGQFFRILEIIILLDLLLPNMTHCIILSL